MATQTYSEARQKVYFKASRELRKVAAEALDDVQNDVELQSEETIRWAINLARVTAEQAREVEDKGHEQCIASNLDETLLLKSKDAYSAAIDSFESRVKAQPGGIYRLGVAKRIRAR